MDKDIIEEVAHEVANEVIESLRSQVTDEAEYMIANYHDLGVDEDSEEYDNAIFNIVQRVTELVLIDWEV